MAAVNLRSYVTTHWSSRGDKEDFIGPEPGEEVCFNQCIYDCRNQSLFSTDTRVLTFLYLFLDESDRA